MSRQDAMRVDEQVIERFFAALLDEVARSRPEYLREPFTIAEIYQELVPYRTHRDVIGVEMNGDYEDALLRLLSGAGNFLKLESEPVRRRLEEELRSRNPNTGIYRDYAAAEVRIHPAHIPTDIQRSAAGAEDALDLALETPGPEEGGGGDPAPDRPAREPAPAADGENGAALGASGGAPDRCPDCRADLPARDSLRFCPFCGTHVFLVECSACGEELERSWRFCLACGEPAEA